MTDNNVVDFRKRKREKTLKIASKQEAKPPKFDITIAKQMIASDPSLQKVVKDLGISTDTGATWIMIVQELLQKIEASVYEAHESSGFSPIFATLVVQTLADASSDELTSLGFCGDIKLKEFDRCKKKAAQSIISALHMDELSNDPSDDEFSPF